MAHEPRNDEDEPAPPTKEIETDLIRNRNNMMSQNVIPTELENVDKKLQLNFSSQTDRAKNKRKILEREFNIATGEANEQRVSPMSLGSDLSPVKEVNYFINL